MSKISNLDSILKELRRKAKDIEELADAVEKMFSNSENKQTMPEHQEKQSTDPQISLSEIKEVLIEKSRAGYDEAVRELINSYGVKKLSQIDPAYYPELKEKAEVIGNG